MFKSNRRIFGVAKTEGGKNTFVTSAVVNPNRPLASSEKSGENLNMGSVVGRSTHTVMNSETVENKDEQQHRLNTTSRVKHGVAVETSSEDDDTVETADYMVGMGNPVQGGATTDITALSMYNDVLYEYFNDNNETNPGPNQTLNKLYRDIYYNDAICGSVVDLMSTLPFSDFSLSGVKDAKKLDLFTNSVERMRISTLLPQLSIEYQVLGAWLGSLSWNESDKIFNAVTPQNLDFVDIMPVPVFGVDPLISLRLPPQLADFLTSSDERVKEYLNLIPDDLRNIGANSLNKLSGKGRKQGNRRDDGLSIPLKSENTIFIPRMAMLKDYKGVSLFRRVIVPWLIEKALMRGTLDQVYKRQRAISHVTAGDEEWKPSNEEMQAIANLFLNADLDPVGSFVVTRNGISVADVRNGGDFWRWDQTHADLATIKLRALGVSETFVSGESSYNTLEATLSVMMEQIRNYRQNITREIFYEKTFPLIAKRNDITIKKYSSAVELGSLDEARNGEYQRNVISQHGNTKVYRTNEGYLVAEIAGGRSNMSALEDIEQYVVPEVNWHKRLMPEADAAYLELLNQMDEKGLPIPVRLLAAAGGLKIDKLLEGQDDDIKLREKLGEWGKKIREINKESGLTPGEEGGGGGEFASAFKGFTEPGVKRKSLGSRRDEGITGEFANIDSQGRRRVMTGDMRKNARDKFNKNVATTMAELAKQENAKPENYNPTKKYYHSKGKKNKRSKRRPSL